MARPPKNVSLSEARETATRGRVALTGPERKHAPWLFVSELFGSSKFEDELDAVLSDLATSVHFARARAPEPDAARRNWAVAYDVVCAIWRQLHPDQILRGAPFGDDSIDTYKTAMQRLVMEIVTSVDTYAAFPAQALSRQTITGEPNTPSARLKPGPAPIRPAKEIKEKQPVRQDHYFQRSALSSPEQRGSMDETKDKFPLDTEWEQSGLSAVKFFEQRFASVSKLERPYLDEVHRAGPRFYRVMATELFDRGQKLSDVFIKRASARGGAIARRGYEVTPDNAFEELQRRRALARERARRARERKRKAPLPTG